MTPQLQTRIQFLLLFRHCNVLPPSSATSILRQCLAYDRRPFSTSLDSHNLSISVWFPSTRPSSSFWSPPARASSYWRNTSCARLRPRRALQNAMRRRLWSLDCPGDTYSSIPSSWVGIANCGLQALDGLTLLRCGLVAGSLYLLSLQGATWAAGTIGRPAI